MTTPVFGSSSAEPPQSRTGAAGGPARPPGRKAVGILLAPVTGRPAALAIVGLPLALFLIIGFAAKGSGSSSGDSGQSPFYGQPEQSQPVYPVASPTYANATDNANSGVSATAQAASEYPSPSPTDTDAAGDTSSASPSPSADSPGTVVLDAYNDVNRHDYQDAYNLGLGQNGETYQSFVEGYSTTQHDTVTIGSVSGDVVSVSLVSVLTDGSAHSYSGTYTVTGGYITGANLQQVN